MNSLRILDEIARNVIVTIDVDEKVCFDAHLLNNMVRGVVQARMNFGQAVMETGDTKKGARRLFRDITLGEIARDLQAHWGNDIVNGMAQFPILTSNEDIDYWTKSPQFPAFVNALQGIGIKMWNTRNQYDGLSLAVFAPVFPKWYVYARGNHALTDEKRLDLLESIQGQYKTFMPEGQRLDEDEIGPVFALMLKEIVPQINEAAPNHDDARRTFGGFIGYYKLCGLDIEAGEIFKLPDFYKELSIFFCDNLFEDSYIPRFRATVARNKQQRA
ncbi:hypothetical protein [Rhizobium sp. BK176]|uniref:hypothetical protein n=1 Tax=Rhizobium sp. BK176 TaxID=2587071 RepID=UPI00216A1746|nr:hypothetical protein [Rhizobium sp. BK176]MCS4088612.1 hypothetical protein [Rhizobium sp. BK176]